MSITELHLHLHNAGLYLKHEGDYYKYLKCNSETFNENYLLKRWKEIDSSYKFLQSLDKTTLQNMTDFVNENFHSMEK